jgi:hypothetical protein
MQTVNVSPADIVGAGQSRALSSEAQSIVDKLKDYYRGIGKPSAAQNYTRHLRTFFAWAESRGLDVHSLPATSVEDFLAALTGAGQKETTIYVTRTQLKTALREAHATLGLDFAHLEYEIGKPKTVRESQKAKEKAKRDAARDETEEGRANAIAAATAAYAAVHTPDEPAYPPEGYAPAYPHETEEAYPMSETGNPQQPPAGGYAPATPSIPPSNTPTVVVMNAPAQASAGRASVTQRTTSASGAATPARGVLVSNHVFTGPYIRISRLADGSDPLSPPGTENIVQTVSAAHVLAHGDIASFLQQWTLPSIIVKPGVSTLQLVFHELNDKKVPTGRRDELSFAVPPGGFGGNVAAGAPASSAAAPAGGNGSPAFDRATEYLLKKLDADADAARKRADDLQEQLREAKDAQTTFLLTQQMQAAQDLKRDLEERKERELMRAMQPPPAPVPVMPPMPPAGLAGLGFLGEANAAPRPDATAEMVKTMAEQQARMMEVMTAAMKPVPQKDSTEFMLTFFANMNQQAQAQAQAQQQMMMQMMQSQQQQSQQFMQVLLAPRENPVEKMLFMQLQEVKAAASAPKEDELEAFAEKMHRVQQLTQMLGGGSQSNFLADLLQNADTIGAGAAQIIAAARGGKAEAAPTKAVQAQQQQLAAPPSAAALPPALPAPVEPPKPTQGMLDAHAAFVAAVEAQNENAVADGFVKLMVELSTAQEPFVSMARNVLRAFAEAEEPEDLYEVAKGLWTAVGKAVFRPHAKAASKVFAKWYAPLHKAFFDVEKALGGQADAEAGEVEAATDDAEGDGEQGDDAEGGEEGAA